MRPADDTADRDRWRAVQELYWTARALGDAERERHLAAAGDDPALLAEVRRLLAADDRAGILDRTPAAVLALQRLTAPPAPERVGPYVVAEEIGRGGMGVVYRARDPRLDRDVALKFLTPAWHRDRDADARFMEEARAASALDHPHVCPVYDIGSADDGRLWIAMAYCGGGSLADRLRAGPLPIADAVRVATQVAGALEEAHHAGIVHRDIKPANIAFTDRGDARVLDFGVAVLGTDEWASPRYAGGTVAYMAPEQVRGGAIDRRTDVWALGVVLYEMLSGRLPFGGAHRQAMHEAILHATPLDLRVARPDIPVALARVVGRALEKDPARRFASASEFAGALREAEANGARLRRTRRWTRAAAAGTLVAAAAYVAVRMVAPNPPAGLVDPAAVVVLPFRVSGEPALEYLREGMVDLLAAKLTGEGGLRAADPRSVHAAWRRAVPDERSDLARDAALALAQRLGAGNVLLGEVVGTDAHLVVNASLVNARGAVVSRATADGQHRELATLVDGLIAQLLSLSAGEEPQRLAALTSTSLPALRAYLEGQAAYRRGRYAEALEGYGRALDLDSTFDLAGLGLDLADGWVGTGHARDRGRAAAWRWRARLSERDRALLYASAGPDYPRPSQVGERIAATERALGLAPDRAELWYALGDLHFHYGRQLGHEDWEQHAEQALARAVALDSGFASALHHLVALFARQGRIADLTAMVNAQLAHAPVGATADYVRWRLAAATGRLGPPAQAALDSLATETLGWIGMNSQDDGAAVPLGQAAVRLRGARPGTVEERFERALSLHALALNAGRPREADAVVDRLRELEPDPGFGWRLRVLSALYGDGDTVAAGAAAAALAERTGGATAAARLNRCVLAQWGFARGEVPAVAPASGVEPDEPARTWLAVCEAVVAAMSATARGDATAAWALERLAAVPDELPGEFFPGDGHTDHASIALARLLERQGDSAGALAALRRRPYFIGWQPFLAASLRHEARLAAALGHRDAAARASEHYLALRQAPEPSRAAIAESVRAELARLRSATR